MKTSVDKVIYSVAEMGCEAFRYHALFQIPPDWYEPGSTSILRNGSRVQTGYLYHKHGFESKKQALTMALSVATVVQETVELMGRDAILGVSFLGEPWAELSLGFLYDFLDHNNGLLS
jgi:hypothetical protein